MGAPNRLWFFDRHTSQLPFFLWLPDDLAYEYSSHSPRPVFKDAFGTRNPREMTPFLRWGRGVSYHELELALSESIGNLAVCDSMLMFNHRQSTLLRASWNASLEGIYSRMLRRIGNGLHQAFAEPSLSLAIRKPV
jgi:S-adenosylmethionine-dependent methyltransferase